MDEMMVIPFLQMAEIQTELLKLAGLAREVLQLKLILVLRYAAMGSGRIKSVMTRTRIMVMDEARHAQWRQVGNEVMKHLLFDGKFLSQALLTHISIAQCYRLHLMKL